MDPDLVKFLVVLAVLAAALWARYRVVAPEPVTTVANPAAATPVRALPGTPDALAAALTRAVDAVVPAPLEAAEARQVLYDQREAEQVVKAVVERVNERSNDVHLAFIPGGLTCRKTTAARRAWTGGAASDTNEYDLAFNAHETSRCFGVRLRADVLVPSDNRLYVRSLRFDTAEDMGGGVPGVSADLPGGRLEQPARVRTPGEVLRALWHAAPAKP